ncbi:MAG: DegT/DnrJ/EryC1/StrS family aminotransferase [Deltaproteobacteria bacterium]|nr:DegT/DnrJ/EryC1/StrS family aminotransferase [Deltaproteobacteria bacterium]MBW2307331.1 DegT/DnrJ/EryC1/StrS family aminotransferase [Deltaproteobacteria bacterium]
MSENIPVFQPSIGVDTIKAVVDAFHVGWLGMGSYTKEFEKKIASFLGLNERQVVATNTGTSALHLACIVAGTAPGDEVITTSFNYAADLQAINMADGKVVLCDINEDDLGIDCTKAEQLITNRTKAIMPLHFAGLPCRISAVYELARKYNLRVIEDATHAFGTRVDGKFIGSSGDITCFSFDPVKVITSIDGGAVVVSRPEDVENLHRLRLLGVDRDTIERYKNKRAWDYDVVSRGFRYHMTNINASIGISQLSRIHEFISSRQRACKLYNEKLRDVKDLIVPNTDYEGISPFIYYIRVLNGKREEVINTLAKNNIASGIHFLPSHRFTFYSNARRSDMSVTERVSREIMTLPLHSGMKTETVEHVARVISEVLT